MYDNRSVTRGMSLESIALQRQGIALEAAKSMPRPRNPSLPRHQLGALRLQDTCHGDFLAHCHQGVSTCIQHIHHLDFDVAAADMLFICIAYGGRENCRFLLRLFFLLVSFAFYFIVTDTSVSCLNRILWRCSQRARGGQGAFRVSDPMVICSDT